MPAATDPRVDAAIAKAASFARPILTHLRALVHRAVPDAEEAIKWSMPTFTLGGKILCTMAAFKAHVAFGFWRQECNDALRRDLAPQDDAMGALGRITSLADLPADRVLTAHLKRAAELTRTGAPSRAPASKKAAATLRMPADLAAALKKNKAASAQWEKFSPGKRKDYIEWITGAKRDATRAARLATTLEWVAEGKARNWKYERC